VRPRKRFGQHFLTDEQVLDAIVRAVKPADDDRMLEIGPGRGALTELLCGEVKTLHAIELDRDLIASLEARFTNLRLTQGDVLALDFAEQLGTREWRLVGNLPYNLSSPLMLELVQHPDLIRDMHFMLQKEMAERMAAQPGSKAWGRLSVMLQLSFQIDSLFDVEPSAFHPPPKVMSQVVRLAPLAADKRPGRQLKDLAQLRRVVAAAFGQRRKTLNNSLKAWSFNFDDFGLEGRQRAEEVSVQQFIALRVSVPVHWS